MGRMTTDRCDHWRGLMAMETIGQVDERDRVALDAHVEGCRACRSERAELAALRPLLVLADPRRAEADELPPGLDDAVLTRLHAEARRDVRHRRFRTAVLSAAAVVAAAAGVLAGTQPWSAPAGSTVAMSGASGARGTVTLVPEPWGTRLELEASGQPAGEVLTVSMRSRSGSWWDAGSYRTGAAGGTVRVDLACAVPAGQVYTVYVRDPSGRTVLRSEPT